MSLNQSEQSKRIFENSPALLQAYPESAILIDRKGRILSVNPVAAERLGKPVGDLVGTCLWECFPDEVVVRRRALAQGVFETGAALCHSDKRNGRQYLTEFHPICNPKGAVEQLAVFAWDVTEARESLVSMQEREREFRALAENSPDVIIRVDPQWRCLYANPAIERFTGLPPEEFLSIRAPFFGEQESIWTRSLEQVFSTGRKCRFQSEYMRKDGQLFHLDWILTPEFGFDGSIEGVLSIIRDITEQVQAKRELERSESKFRLLFENISDPVFIRALEGGRLGPLLQVNKAACEVYGYTHEEWSSLSIGDLIVPERKHKVPSVVQDMIRRKDAIIETMHITKHGRRIPVEAHLRVTVMEGRQVLLSTVRDISARKEAEEELTKSLFSRKQQNSLLQGILESTTDGILVIDPHKRWTLYNNRFLRMWNLKEPSEASEGEMLEKILGQVVDRKAFLTGFTIRFEDGKDEYMDIVQCKDGRFMERSFQPLFVDGSYVGRIATFRDVTDQVVYERELARSQETLQAILNGMSSYVYVIDLQTHEILFANKFLQDFIGSNPVGRKCWKIFHDRISGPCPSCLTPNLYDRDSAGHYECELYNEKFERWFFLQKRIIRWDDGRMALLEIAIDVTARKQAEEEMLRAKDFSETLIRSANAIIIGIDEQGRITIFNNAAEQVTGYASEEVLGKNWFDIFVPREIRPTMRQGFQQGIENFPRMYENPILTKSGEQRIISWRNSSIEVDGVIQGISFGIDITARRIAEQQLKEQALFVRTLMDAAPSPIFLIDTDGVHISCNSAFLGFMGMEEGEIIGKNVQDFIPRNYTRECVEQNAVLQKNGGTLNYEGVVRVSSGEWRNVIFTKSLFRLGAEANGILAIITDITEQKRIQRELTDNKRYLSTLLSNLPGMAYRCRNEAGWPMDCVSAGALELTGHAPEELTSNFGVEYGRIIHPDDRDIVWGRIQEAIEKKESFQIVYRIITRDGRTRWVWERGRAVLSSDGCARRIEGFISDITERKRTEEELVRLFAAVEHAAGAILIHDPDLTVRYVNPAYEKISGYPAEEILGKRVGVLNPDQKYLSPQELEEIVEKVQAKGKWVGRMERSTKQGRTYAVEAVISPILDSGNGIAGYAEFWRDVTQEEELQKQLIQAQKMEAIGTLAGGIAHDFNNILASIMGFSELAQIKASGNQALQRDLGMILKASDRAKDLVGQILAFSRKTEYKKRSLRLGPLFRECIKMLRATIPSTVEIDLSIQTSSDLVVMDAVQMHQVLTNLCSNAAHAMPDGGSLRIRIKEPSADKQLPPFATPGEYVQIEVEDTGFGMHKDVLDRIFDPFFTTKKPGEGTGMGLSVVHGIIKKHKGHVAVTTEPGKGTLFTILLPRGKEDSKSPPDRGERTGHKGGGRVLYVDDEKTLVYMADRMLRNLGYSVRTSRDSMEALEWVVQDPHSFDLVITDQVMPRLTGIEFANEIKRIRKDLPVLLISGFSKIDPDRSFSQTGVEGFLQKPFRQHELAAAIQSIFETETNHKQQ